MATKAPRVTPDELRSIRINCSLSVPDAARRVGVSRVTWWRWEEDDGAVPERLYKVIRALKDTTEDDQPTDTTVQIPIYSIAASAGPGADIGLERAIGHLGMEREYIRAAFQVDPATLAAVTIEGDSMEPTIRSGELALVSLAKEGWTTGDGIHILRLDGAILCKRIARLPGRKAVVTSDNGAAGPAFEVDLQAPATDFAVVGRVLSVLRRV